MNKERAGGFSLLLVGCLGIVFSLKLPMGKFIEPGPGIFPAILSTLLSICGLFIFLTGKDAKKPSDEKESGGRFTPLLIVLFTGAFIIGLGKLGYLLGSFLYLLFLFSLVSRLRIFVSLALSAIMAAASWYFFGSILGIHLPRGFWGL